MSDFKILVSPSLKERKLRYAARSIRGRSKKDK